MCTFFAYLLCNTRGSCFGQLKRRFKNKTKNSLIAFTPHFSRQNKALRDTLFTLFLVHRFGNIYATLDLIYNWAGHFYSLQRELAIVLSFTNLATTRFRTNLEFKSSMSTNTKLPKHILRIHSDLKRLFIISRQRKMQ